MGSTIIAKKLLLLIILPFTISFVYAEKKITVVTDDNYPPYIFRDKDGNLQGILVDQWNLWSSRTGVKVYLKGMDWAKALAAMKKGEADVIDTLFWTEERTNYFDYGNPYATIEVPVFFEQSVSGIVSISSLAGYVVGVKEGDACIDTLKKNGILSLKEYPNYESIILDAAKGNIYVFCIDKPPALYYIHKYHLEEKFKYALSLGGGQFHRAVQKGDRATLELVEKGFALISDNEYKAIDSRWLGEDIQPRINYKFVAYIVITSIAVAAFFVLIALYLNYKVRERTKELEDAIIKLRESEVKTKALIEVIPDLLFVFDEKGTFVDYRANSLDRLYLPPEEFIGKRVDEVMPSNIADITFKAIDELKKGTSLYSYDYELNMDGTVLFFDARMVPFGEGKFVSIVRDISEKKKREEEETRRHKLESLGIFAGGIAHDFNNILTAIVGGISLARIRLDDKDKALRLLEESEKAAIRARKLTEQLLAFAKGGKPVKRISSISDLIAETANFILSGSRVMLSIKIAEDLKFVDIDRGQIEQVIQNIILNAVQAMPYGGKIEIKADNIYLNGNNPFLLPEGSYVYIAVADNGEGIEQKNLSKIFDPYFTTKVDGNGLGLTICHTIIKRHGGAIDVKSQVGVGTTFTIFLPACENADDLKVFNESTPIQGSLQGKVVLVIDDEPQLRFIMKEALSPEGAQVILTPEGHEAMDIFEERVARGEKVDFVVADLTIPGGMGGMEAVRLLREAGFSFKAIVVSGYSNDPVIADFKSYGFDGYLVKPFGMDLLIKTLKSLV